MGWFFGSIAYLFLGILALHLWMRDIECPEGEEPSHWHLTWVIPLVLVLWVTWPISIPAEMALCSSVFQRKEE